MSGIHERDMDSKYVQIADPELCARDSHELERLESLDTVIGRKDFAQSASTRVGMPLFPTGMRF
jgi:hypothetical protein